MKKLLDGIVKFRRDVLPNYRDTFARLALGQTPDVLFIGCSDSRVAVNVFASTDPGDLFVVRNVGNLVPIYPAYNDAAQPTASNSVAAAIEFALNTLNVSNIIICGHSECGAMQALVTGREKIKTPLLREWLSHGDVALKKLDSVLKSPNLSDLAKSLTRYNQLSQLNVLQQIENLKTYPAVQERLRSKKLTLHGWWFELSRADVYAFEEALDKFVLIDETEATRILARMNSKG